MNQKERKSFDKAFEKAFRSKRESKQKNVYVVVSTRFDLSFPKLHGIFTERELSKIDIEGKDVFVIPFNTLIKRGVEVRSYVAWHGKYAMKRKVKK